MKKIIALAFAASVAVGAVAGDIVSWKGAELSAWTMDESFTSFSFMMPYIMSPMKRATG